MTAKVGSQQKRRGGVKEGCDEENFNFPATALAPLSFAWAKALAKTTLIEFDATGYGIIKDRKLVPCWKKLFPS